MKLHAVAIALLTASIGQAEDSIVAIDYFHSLRIPNSRIEVALDTAGALVVTTESRGKNKTTKTTQITDQKLNRLKTDLARIDWAHAAADKSRGLDGTSVRIAYGGMSVSLWSPDYNCKKRRLERLQKAIEEVFTLAGLDKTGMPR